MKFKSSKLSFIAGLLFLFQSSANAGLPSDYQSFTAAEKQDLLWYKLDSSVWDPMPELSGGGWSSILKNLKAFLSLKQSFDHSSDELPTGRPKVIHTYGSVGKVEFVPASGHTFTGMYETGAVGIARLSLAANPAKASYTPGMALKFLINGKPSRNLHVMNALEGQKDNWDFFAKDFSNKIAKPTGFVLKMVGWVFSLARSPATDLPVQHLAMIHANGEKVDKVRSPKRLLFKPAAEVKGLISKKSREDFRVSLEGVQSDRPLYEVYAVGDSGDEIHVGTLKLTSPLVASYYGDKKLFFQHQR